MVTAYPSSYCCSTCIAGMLIFQHMSAASTSASRPRGLRSNQGGLLGVYEPNTNVNAISALDVDFRYITASLAKGDEDGLAQAKEVYANGFSSGSGELTIKELGPRVIDNLASPTFGHFADYYGGSDFADKWIEASFEGSDFDYGKGSFRFSTFGTEGRTAAVRWGIPLLQIWMGVISLLESAGNGCTSSGDNIDQIAKWDKAVALYFGSEATSVDDIGDGHFIYSLMNFEGYKWGKVQKGEQSPANTDVLESFRWGKIHLSDGNCASLEKEARDIKKQMTALLVQGTLRAMYAMDVQDDFQETTQGMGAAFAAALLPHLNKCHPNNALVVHNDMTPGKGKQGSFEVVKAAIERSYACLGINCDDIGGLVDYSGNGYLKGAEDCTKSVSGESSSSGYQGNDFPTDSTARDAAPQNPVSPPELNSSDEGTENIALIVGATLGSLGGFLLGLLVAWWYTKSKMAKKEIVLGMTVHTDTEASPEDTDPKGDEGEII